MSSLSDRCTHDSRQSALVWTVYRLRPQQRSAAVVETGLRVPEYDVRLASEIHSFVVLVLEKNGTGSTIRSVQKSVSPTQSIV